MCAIEEALFFSMGWKPFQGSMIRGGLHPSMLGQSSGTFGGSGQLSAFVQSMAMHMHEPFDWSRGL